MSHNARQRPGVWKVEPDTVPEKQTKRMKEYQRLFPEGKNGESEYDGSVEYSLEQPSPLKIVDTFVSVNSDNSTK